MRFNLVDQVIERSDERIVARKQVSLAEEYLGDHFPDFPVLPGVMIVETMVQAARMLIEGRDEAPAEPLVLGEVRALKFASMVRPGESLEVEVTLGKPLDDGRFGFRGTGRVRRAGGDDGRGDDETVASGRFTMRPIRD